MSRRGAMRIELAATAVVWLEEGRWRNGRNSYGRCGGSLIT
jgi:hypothetical protein